MKNYYVEFEFPDLPSGIFRQTWRGMATNLGKAPFEAFKEVRRRPGVKGRRVNSMKVLAVKMVEPTAPNEVPA